VRRAPFVALLLSAVIAVACSAVPELRFDPDGGGSPGGDGGTSGGPCVNTGPEVCDDGIDNDCDGRIDCADGACGPRYTCADRAPDDWQVIALAEGSRPGCPAGFGESKDVRTVTGNTGPAVCGCACGGGTACAAAGIAVGFDNDVGCDATNQTFAVRSQCERLQGNGFSIGTNTFARAVMGNAGACPANPQGTLPPVRDSRTCALPKVGGGCGSAQVCVPRTSNVYAVCVTKPGSVACPGAFPSTRHAGTGATDTRSCSGCTCTAGPCTGEVKLYDNRDCNDGVKLTLNAVAPPVTCAQRTNGSFQARGYTSTVAGGCVTATPAQGSGTLTLAGETTICCR
jgi:hypothetical protein